MKKKITLEEAQDLYSKNESVREFLESKFSKEELTKTTESLEEKFQRVWEDKILSQCDVARFLDLKGNPSKIPTSRIEVLNKKVEWLFDYDYSPKNKSFLFSYHLVYEVLNKEVSSDINVLQGLIYIWVKNTLGLEGVVPDVNTLGLGGWYLSD